MTSKRDHGKFRRTLLTMHDADSMFIKRVLYYVYHPEELERTIEVVNRTLATFFAQFEDEDRFDYESPATGRGY
jgi:hypothetical protein